MNFAVTLSDTVGLVRDIHGEPRVMYLDIENRESSTGTLFVADEPPGSVEMGATIHPDFSYLDHSAGVMKNGVEVGMSVGSGLALPDGTQVVRLESMTDGVTRVHISQLPQLEGEFFFTYSAPPLAEATGITLRPGQRREYTAEQGNAFLDRTVRLYALAGTQCDVVIRRGKR